MICCADKIRNKFGATLILWNMRIHFIGCEGASMKALGKIARADGSVVTGSDIALNGHSEQNVAGADLAVYSSAIPDDNAELTYAREHGIKIMSRAEFLGQICRGYKTTIAVAGSHGKTTCTAMLGCIFAPLNATVHLGGEYNGENGHVGGKRFFITEACEYKRNFLHILPQISVVLNVELDHTDYYRDLDDITNAFNVFSRSAPLRIVCGDDERSAPLRDGKHISFGLNENNDFFAREISESRDGASFILAGKSGDYGKIELKVLGRHNVFNAVAAAAAAIGAGVQFDSIKRGLESFTGVKRRLEYLGRLGECFVYTDYAHHPREIESMLSCVRGAGFKRIAVAFQPHTYTRTQSLLHGFSQGLCKADDILIAEVYAAREEPIAGVSGNLLCRAIIESGHSARYCGTFFELNEQAVRLAEKCDALIYCGAGDIDVAARTLFL